MHRILLAGVAVADFVFNVGNMPVKAEKYRAKDAFFSGGGNAANSAVAVKRLGGEAVLAARIGTDIIGDIVLNDLKNEDVDVSQIRRVAGGNTSFSSIYVDDDGERQIMNYRGQGLDIPVDWLEDLPKIDTVLADNRYPPLTRKAIEVAKSREIPIVIDAEPPFEAEVVQDATHIAFSYQGIKNFTCIEEPEAALIKASDELNTWVCVTDGANGTYFLENGIPFNIPPVAVEAVDTLGAGDVWHAAFALMLAEGAGTRDAIIFANAAGTIKCTRVGGRNGAPSREEVEGFIKSHSSD